MSNSTHLTEEDLKRYDRHLRLSDFGMNKQLKLKQSKVLIVGAGGLGCPIGLYLAASGVGTIGIADDDTIEISNLQRQVAFSFEEIGDLKCVTLVKKLLALNPLLHIIDHSLRINTVNAKALIENYDLVIDGTDNFASRFLLADACFLNKIAYLHASVYQYEGQISLFPPGSSPCFRCLFRRPPLASALPACSEAGILGVVTGTVGLLAATEAIKYLTNLGDSLAHKILIYNALTQQMKKITIEIDENCPLCSKSATTIKSTKGEKEMPAEKSVSIEEASEWIKNDKDLCLLDVREIHEYEEGHIENAALLPLSFLKTMPFPSPASATACSTPTKQSPEQKEYLAALPENKDKKILCYCRRGGRSLQATDILRYAGYTNTYSMDGGIEAWPES